MTLKKIAAFAGSAALLLGTATPALAYEFGGLHHGSLDAAYVENGAAALANTGDNTQTNSAAGALVYGDVETEDVNNLIVTGDAYAGARAVAITNTHVGDCGCESRGHKDLAMVSNGALAEANTGYNSQTNSAAGLGVGGEVEVERTDNAIVTGNAVAEADAWAVTNTHLSFGGLDFVE